VKKNVLRALAHGKSVKHVVQICRVDKDVVPELTLALTGLARKNVAAVGLLALDLTAACDLEALFRSTIGLHLRHDYSVRWRD